MKVSILQWNIWYREDIENITKFIKKYEPDIVCLQELTKNFPEQSQSDTIAYIARTMGYNHHSQAMGFVQSDKPWQQANGIFTKFPIRDTRSVWINEPIGAGGYDDEHRAYIEATLDVNGQALTVGATHMSYTSGFTITERKRQETKRLVPELRKHGDNFIFTGDLNAVPDSYTIKEVSKHLKNAGPDYDQKTWTTKPFSDRRGFETGQLNWRLDYVFATPDVKIRSSEIIRTEYSDHLPVLATLEVDRA